MELEVFGGEVFFGFNQLNDTFLLATHVAKVVGYGVLRPRTRATTAIVYGPYLREIEAVCTYIYILKQKMA